MPVDPKNTKNLILVFLWIAAIGFGFERLFAYSNTSGISANAAAWPRSATIPLNPQVPTLLAFVHPRCPCSAATVGELEMLEAEMAGKLDIFVVFARPKGRSQSWAQEALWEKASKIPNIHLVHDDGAIEAEKFDARTSGQVFLYGAAGNLVFRGGITPSRGHIGPNEGSDAIRAYLNSGKVALATTPVFGCSLRNPERALAGQNREMNSGP